MKGKLKGVLAKLLEMNSRALFVPCGAHRANIVVSDGVKSSTDATGYFGSLQNLFTLFFSIYTKMDNKKKMLTYL